MTVPLKIAIFSVTVFFNRLFLLKPKLLDSVLCIFLICIINGSAREKIIIVLKVVTKAVK